MAEQYGILAQLFPAAGAATQLYAAPATSQVVVSSLMVNNQAAAADRVFVSLRKGGTSSDTPAQYLYGAGPGMTGGGLKVPAHNPFAATLGLTLGPSDQIWVRSSNGTSSFQLFGTTVPQV